MLRLVRGFTAGIPLSLCPSVDPLWSLFAVGLGNVPDSSRRSSSGVMCGAVRRPGELRVTDELSSVIVWSAGGERSREATCGVDEFCVADEDCPLPCPVRDEEFEELVFDLLPAPVPCC